MRKWFPYVSAFARLDGAGTRLRTQKGEFVITGAYESLLASYGTTPSHSRKGSPWQNGYQESFYNNFKLELGVVRRFNHVGELIGSHPPADPLLQQRADPLRP